MKAALALTINYLTLRRAVLAKPSKPEPNNHAAAGTCTACVCAQGVINTSSVAELLVPLPPLAEQKKIIEYLNEFQAEAQRLESIYQQKITTLDELKKALLHKAFSGEL